jgi:hypothetical protein
MEEDREKMQQTMRDLHDRLSEATSSVFRFSDQEIAALIAALEIAGDM